MDVMETVPCFSFACDAPNCELTFEDEDQLGQHRRKHSLSLKLPSKSSDVNSSGIHVPVVDETPTPCRFLKNFSTVPTDFLDGINTNGGSSGNFSTVPTDFLDGINTNGESPGKNSPFSSNHNPFAETFRRASFSAPKLCIPDSATKMLIDEDSESLNTPSITINPATESPEAGQPDGRTVVKSPLINTPFIPLVPGTNSTKTVIVKCLDPVQVRSLGLVQDTEVGKTSDVADLTTTLQAAPLIPLAPGTKCIRTLTVKRLESPKESMAAIKTNVSEECTMETDVRETSATLRPSTLTSISKLVGKPMKVIRTIPTNGTMQPIQQIPHSSLKKQQIQQISHSYMKKEQIQQISHSPLKKILPKPCSTSGDVQVIIRTSNGEITIPIPSSASNNSVPSSFSVLKSDRTQSYHGMVTKVAPTIPTKVLSSESTSESIREVSSEPVEVSNEGSEEPSTSAPISCPNGSCQGSQSSSSQSSISSSSQSSDTSPSCSVVKKIGRGRRAIDETSEQRLARIRHKNRQAATRCRQKKRTWEQSLGSRIDQLKDFKRELMTEETNLKMQTAKLKKALLAHKECSQLIINRS